MHKIVLGTAQFGMDYGINNKRGMIPQAEAFDIFSKAMEIGIDTFDTAYEYGESERVLGSFIKAGANRPKIISKLPKCGKEEVREIVNASLRNLEIPSIYGYLVHNFEAYRKERGVWDELEKLKKSGRIQKVGFSIYFPRELEFILEGGLRLDMIQVPFSVFDQRFAPYLAELKNRKTEIYARSVFLQGLVFKKSVELDSYFGGMRAKIEQLNLLTQEYGIPVFALCVNFVAKNEFVNKVIVGIDSIGHLEEIMQAPNFLLKSDSVIPQVSNLRVDDENIIVPSNWNLSKAVSK